MGGRVCYSSSQKLELDVGMSRAKQAGKLAQLYREMRRYKLSIIGVCESRWNTFGKVTTSSGETYLYSGNEREENAHTHGVGLLLSKDAAKSLIEWDIQVVMGDMNAKIGMDNNNWKGTMGK